jgi:hypothetical protein
LAPGPAQWLQAGLALGRGAKQILKLRDLKRRVTERAGKHGLSFRIFKVIRYQLSSQNFRFDLPADQ